MPCRSCITINITEQMSVCEIDVSCLRYATKTFLSITGDDEQSDFFYEAGPACGIPGIIPWWESDKNDEDSHSNCDPTFQKILTGSFDFMSNSSKRNFKTRVSKLLARVSVKHLCSQLNQAFLLTTRKHSSRMRTVRLSTIRAS